MTTDTLNRFLFDNANVRGELVQLGTAFAEMVANHNYPDAVTRLLGELLAATSLLTALLKFEGSINVQLQGDGPVRLLVVNGDNQQRFRGVARLAGEVSGEGLRALLGSGHLVITISPDEGERYQGVVALDGTTIGECLERYFSQSEQLETRIWLHAEAGATPRAGGLLLQRLPAANDAQRHDDFDHLTILGATLSADELFTLPAITLLHRLYHEEQITTFPPQPLTFVCGCSRDKSASALHALGRDECEALLAEQGTISIHCEYCATDYRFTQGDVETLFGSRTRHGPH